MTKCPKCEKYIPVFFKKCPICTFQIKNIQKIITRKDEKLEIESIELPSLSIPMLKTL